MTQRETRTLLSDDEGLTAVGRRQRIRKIPEAVDAEKHREDKMLKELGLYEMGMTQEQKKELLLVVVASEKSTTMEMSRQISGELAGDSDRNPELFRFSQNTTEHPNGKLQESPDMLDIIFQSPKRQSEKENTPENEDTNFPYLIVDDTFTRKYDGYQIDPLNFIEDTRSIRLIDKRKYVNKKESYWDCCCPDGTKPRNFAKTLHDNFETYHKNLYAFQRRSPNYLKWGDPVVVGRHCTNTLDLWSSSLSSRLRMISEAVKEQNEMINSKSENEFDNLGNGERRYQTYGQNRHEKPKDSEKCVFTFTGSSDEDVDVENDYGTFALHDLLREAEQSRSADASEQESDEYVPGRQPAKKKRRLWQLGLVKPRPKTASQKINIHDDISVEARSRVGAPKQSSNLQDVIKPSLKINFDKVEFRNKWQCNNGRPDQLLCSDKANDSSEEIEIVDTFATSKGGDVTVRQKVRATRKLTNVARSVKPFGNRVYLGLERNLSKRQRLSNISDSENEETVKHDKAKKVLSTYRKPYSTNFPKSEEVDELPKNVDVPCPLCSKKYAQSEIEAHASDCRLEDDPSRIPTR